MKKWSSQWTQFMQLRKEAWKKKERSSTGFEPVTSRYRCDALPAELWRHWRWCRSIVGSYVHAREMSVNDIRNKSYVNCGNEMKWRNDLFVFVSFISVFSILKCKTLVLKTTTWWTRASHFVVDGWQLVRCQIRFFPTPYVVDHLTFVREGVSLI